MGFSKEAFKAANNASSGEFPTVKSGTYIAEVVRMEIKTSRREDSQAEQFSIGWRIDDDSEEYAGQWIFQSQNIKKSDGTDNEIGLQQTNMILNKLSAGQFSIDDFDTTIDDDGEEIIINEEKVFDKFIGTRAKITVKLVERNGYENHEVKVKTVIESTYDAKVTSDSNELEADVDAPFDTEEEDSTQDAAQGQKVVFQNKKGTWVEGTIINFIEGQGDSPGMVMVQPNNVKDKPIAIVEHDVQIVEDSPQTIAATNKETSLETEEELSLEKEDEKPKLEKGVTVSAKWQGETYTGKVHKVDELEGTVIVAFNGKGRPHKISEVTVV